MKTAVQEIDKDTRDNNVAVLTEEIENALAEKLGEEEFEKIASSYPKNAFGVGANYRVYLIIKLPKIQ